MKRTYRDQIEGLEAIGAFLIANIPSDWDRIATRCELEGSIPFLRSNFKPPGAAQVRHFGIRNGEDSLDFGDCFLQLAQLVGDPKTGPFKACRYTLEKSGRYHVDYEY